MSKDNPDYSGINEEIRKQLEEVIEIEPPKEEHILKRSIIRRVPKFNTSLEEITKKKILKRKRFLRKNKKAPGKGVLTLKQAFEPLFDLFGMKATGNIFKDFGLLADALEDERKFARSIFGYIFDIYDEDGSGDIDVGELESLLKDIGESTGDIGLAHINKSTLEKVMIDVDVNKDGSIDKNEFVTYMVSWIECESESDEDEDEYEVLRKLGIMPGQKKKSKPPKDSRDKEITYPEKEQVRINDEGRNANKFKLKASKITYPSSTSNFDPRHNSDSLDDFEKEIQRNPSALE